MPELVQISSFRGSQYQVALGDVQPTVGSQFLYFYNSAAPDIATTFLYPVQVIGPPENAVFCHNMPAPRWLGLERGTTTLGFCASAFYRHTTGNSRFSLAFICTNGQLNRFSLETSLVYDYIPGSDNDRTRLRSEIVDHFCSENCFCKGDSPGELNPAWFGQSIPSAYSRILESFVGEVNFSWKFSEESSSYRILVSSANILGIKTR
jgi:hypothetical protein